MIQIIELNWISLYNSHLFDHDHWSVWLESNDPAHTSPVIRLVDPEVRKNNQRPIKKHYWRNWEGVKVNRGFPRFRDQSMRFTEFVASFQLLQRYNTIQFHHPEGVRITIYCHKWPIETRIKQFTWEVEDIEHQMAQNSNTMNHGIEF